MLDETPTTRRTLRLPERTDQFIQQNAAWRGVGMSEVIRDALQLLAFEQATYLLAVDPVAEIEGREGVPTEDVLAELASRRSELIDAMFGDRVLGPSEHERMIDRT